MQNYGLITCLRTSNNSQRSIHYYFLVNIYNLIKILVLLLKESSVLTCLHYMFVMPTIIRDNETYI